MFTSQQKYIDKCYLRDYNLFTESTTGGDYMSERERQVITKLIEAIPKMSEFDKGYILGKTESLATNSKHQEEKKTVQVAK